MQRKSLERVVFFIGLFIAFFLDGSISQLAAPLLFNYPYTAVPYLTVLWLVLSVFFISTIKINFVFWAAVIGFIFDVYYTGVLGVSIFIFPLTVMITRGLYHALAPNFLSDFLIFFIDITFIIIVSYIAMAMIGQTHLSISELLVNALAPSLALNLIFLVLLYYPIFSLYDKFR